MKQTAGTQYKVRDKLDASHCSGLNPLRGGTACLDGWHGFEPDLLSHVDSFVVGGIVSQGPASARPAAPRSQTIQCTSFEHAMSDAGRAEEPACRIDIVETFAIGLKRINNMAVVSVVS